VHNLKQHIIFKLATLIIVVSILVPTAVKFAHVFSHHKHQVCKEGNKTHIHKVDLDCEFHKFQLNKNFTFNKLAFTLFSPQEKPIEIVSQYQFISEYQHLQFSLRGPPSLV